MTYDLPKFVEINGDNVPIRFDYRAVLDICAALSDIDLSGQEKAFVCLDIFYPTFYELPPGSYEEAIKKCFWFINGGKTEENQKKERPIMNWEKDFPLIVGPVNRVLGREIRDETPIHWWTFLFAYYEIGDCLFAQVVRIRDKKARGKKLDNQEKEFYKRNREIIDIKTQYSSSENELLKMWAGK